MFLRSFGWVGSSNPGPTVTCGSQATLASLAPPLLGELCGRLRRGSRKGESLLPVPPHPRASFAAQSRRTSIPPTPANMTAAASLTRSPGISASSAALRSASPWAWPWTVRGTHGAVESGSCGGAECKGGRFLPGSLQGRVVASPGQVRLIVKSWSQIRGRVPSSQRKWNSWVGLMLLAL